MGLPVGGFNDEVGEVSSTFLFAGCFLFFTEEPGFPFCQAAVTMMDGFLQLVACWLAAQTGLFLCCFWGGGGDVCHVCIALVLPHFHHVWTFSRSFFSVCQFLIRHFTGLRAQRLFSVV